MICRESAAAALAHLESEHGGSANTPTLQRWKGNTDIWQKYGQSWWKYNLLLKEIHSTDGRDIPIFERNTDKIDGNIILFWKKYIYLTEILTKLREILFSFEGKYMWSLKWKKSTEIYNNIDISVGNWYRVSKIHVFKWNAEQTDRDAYIWEKSQFRKNHVRKN